MLKAVDQNSVMMPGNTKTEYFQMNSLAIPLPMYKSLIYFFFFLSGLSHNLNKYPNYHHCSSHIFVKSPEKSQKNTLPTRPFGPETTCSSSPWKTGLQIGHRLGKATDHQLSLASHRKHQLGDSRHPSKGSGSHWATREWKEPGHLQFSHPCRHHADAHCEQSMRADVPGLMSPHGLCFSVL